MCPTFEIFQLVLFNFLEVLCDCHWFSNSRGFFDGCTCRREKLPFSLRCKLPEAGVESTISVVVVVGRPANGQFVLPLAQVPAVLEQFPSHRADLAVFLQCKGLVVALPDPPNQLVDC